MLFSGKPTQGDTESVPCYYTGFFGILLWEKRLADLAGHLLRVVGLPYPTADGHAGRAAGDRISYKLQCRSFGAGLGTPGDNDG
jgi:hypothetical protein